MNSLDFAVACVPLAAYLIMIGGLHFRRRAMVVPGSRDLAALGLGLAGFAVIGPFRLFLPLSSLYVWGQYVWLLVLVLYQLIVTLVILYSRPRLVIYNMGLERLRPLIGETAVRMDPQARWAGDNLVMPSQGIQFHLEASSGLRNVSLVATGLTQSLPGWQRLEHQLKTALKKVAVRRNFWGAVLIMAGLALLCFTVAWLIWEPPLAVELPG